MKKFTVIRDKWLRGSYGKSKLRDCNGNQCCVGFYLQSCGVQSDVLFDKGHAGLIQEHIPSEAKWLIENPGYPITWGKSNVAIDLYGTNDTPQIENDASREVQLKDLFALQNIEVEFV